MRSDVLGVDSDDSLAAALAYAALGWRVVPTPAESKHPRLPAWQDVATNDDAQITDWWGTRYHGDGISIVCGPSGLVVIDVDRHGPIDGDDSLADLEATYGKLPDCPVVLTGGGGRHLYFAAPRGVTITNDAGRRLGPGLDVRAQGGQVVAPPSLHESGRRYTWEASSLPSVHGIFETRPDHVALEPLPDWLVALLMSPVPEPQPRSPVVPGSNGHLPGQQWAAVTEWADLLWADGARLVGVRTDHVSGLAYELWARPGVDHASATLRYGGSDVLKVFSTNWPGLDAEATYTKFGYLAATRHHGDFQAARAALEGQGFTFKPVDIVTQLVVQSAEAAAARHPRKVTSMSSLHNQHFDPLRFAVPNIVPEGLTLLVGPPKAGKSWLALGWLLGVSTGGRLLGADHDAAPRPVLYLALEDSHRRLQARMRALTLPGEAWPDIFEYTIDVDPGEVVDLVIGWLDDHADASPFVVLDTLGKVLPPAVAGESSYQRDYRISGAMKAMVDAYPGASLLINHHDRKAAAEDFVDSVSGTHGLAGAADTVIVLARKRHTSDALLQVTGRDVNEVAYVVDFANGVWTLRGGSFESAAAAAETLRSSMMLGSRARSVLSYLEDNPDGLRYRDIEAGVGFQPGKELQRLIDTGQARKASRGLYVIALDAVDSSQTPSPSRPPGALGATAAEEPPRPDASTPPEGEGEREIRSVSDDTEDDES